MNWFEEVERAQADGWAMPTSEQWKVLHEMGREHQQYMDTWAKLFEEAIDRTVIEWKGMIKHVETTDKYRRQMKEAGRENEKW